MKKNKSLSGYHFNSFMKKTMENDDYIEFKLTEECSKNNTAKYYKIIDGMYLYNDTMSYEKAKSDTDLYEGLLISYLLYEGSYTATVINERGEEKYQKIKEGDVLRFAGDIKFKDVEYLSDCYGAIGIYCYYKQLLESLRELHFDTSKVTKFYEDFNKYGFILIDSFDSYYKNIAKDIMKYLKENNYYMAKLKSLELLDWTISHYSFNANSYKNKYLDSILKVKEEIDMFPERNYSISSLSKKCNISETYFKSIFKDTFNDSPYNYILRKRLDKAAALLKNSNISIQSISENLNYASPSKFAKDFKKAYFCTPREYRKLSDCYI